MTTDPLDLLASRLTRVKPKAGRDGFMACCPAHDDQHASLSVDRGDNGSAVLKCFAGCEMEQIVAAIGLCATDLWPPKEPARPSCPGERRMVAAYNYEDEAGTLLYQAVRYEPKDFRQRRPDPNGGWVYKLNGTRPVLYHLPDIVRAKPEEWVIVAEGEKDVDRLRRDRFVATCHAGGTGNTQRMLPVYVETLKGRHVAIIPDNDDPGRQSATAIATALHDHAASVRFVTLAALPPKGDVSDWLDAGHTAAELRAKIETTPEWMPSATAAATLAPQAALKVVRLDQIEEREIDWLWRGWLARRELSIHAAHPGLGKTTFSLALAAAFSTGGTLPDGTRAPIVNTLLLLAEDSVETTVKKGLRLHGADTSRIFFSQAVLDQDGSERAINLDRHLPEIEGIVREHDIGLVIIDPLTGFTPGKDRNSDGDVRDSLTPLRQLAERHQFGVLGVAHFGKPNGSQRTLLQSLLGSTGYVALARTVLASAELPEQQQPEDADDETGRLRITQVIKSNLDIKPPAVTWRRPKDSAIVWLGTSDLDVEDVLTAPRERSSGTVERAMTFLREQLTGGSKPVTELEQLAKEEQLSWASVRRAKTTLGVVSKKLPSHDGAWLWMLPVGSPQSVSAPDGEDAQPPVEGAQSPYADKLSTFNSEPGTAEDAQGAQVSTLAQLSQEWPGEADDDAWWNEESNLKVLNAPYTDNLSTFNETDEIATADHDEFVWSPHR